MAAYLQNKLYTINN